MRERHIREIHEGDTRGKIHEGRYIREINEGKINEGDK